MIKWGTLRSKADLKALFIVRISYCVKNETHSNVKVVISTCIPLSLQLSTLH